MKKITILFIAVMIIHQLSAEWIDTSNTGELFTSNSENINQTVIQFSLDGFESETVTENGVEYKKITYDMEGKFLEAGKPDLPRFSRLIAIPDRGEPHVLIDVISEEIFTNIVVYPSQELQSESQIQNRSFIIDDNYYNSSEVFPAILAQADTPAIMRDLRVVNITINPFQYDPAKKELRVITEMQVIVDVIGNRGNNIKITDRSPSRSFDSLYKAAILNYDDIPMRDDLYQDPSYLFIYADENDVLENLNYLTEWKHSKGFEVNIASTTETGTSLNDIKDYIQNAYDNWPNRPEFICLVGDAGGNYNIPTGHIDGGMYNGEGDQIYALLEGDDILADVHLGRLSFNEISELQTIVSKILHYEKEPYMGNTDWYNKVLLVGDPTDSGPSTIDTKQNIAEMINYYYPDMQNIEVYDTSQGSWQSQISNNINAGVSYFNYRGFANMSGFDVWHINNNLSNGFMLPVAVTLTCITGDFEGTIDCRSEAFLKAGTPSTPQGAIAAIATATGNTHTCFNNCVDAGIFYGLFVEDIPNMGAALNRGKLNLYINYPGNPGNHVNQFSYWNTLMGDPGMDLWSAVPQTFTATYENQLQAGTNYIEVNVADESGIPQENAWVTILQGNDEIFETAYTNADGNVLLPIPENSIGEIQLTITKRNFIPHLGSFDIVQETSFVSFASASIDDDDSGTSAGNNDGLINPGETIELSVSLQNNGTQTANNITAVITTECDFITINDDTETFGNIPAGNTATSADDYDFTLSADALDSDEIVFEITILEDGGVFWTDHIFLPISAPKLAFQSYIIDDGNNGILYPGETADLQISIDNIGSITADNIEAELLCLNTNIIINDNIGTFGSISSGATALNNSDPFEISASVVTIPGTEIIFDLHLYNDDGYDDTIEFTIVVGEPQITDPLGPDEFGYYCYDDGDVAYLEAPVYQWIEIDPQYGGSGTMLQLFDNGNMGDTENIDLPFVLTFYGVEYNTATICSNGWLAPGETDLRSFMNWEIPGPLGPSPIIAPFWDDLMTNTGDVFYYYNSAQHFFVIEWSRLSIEYNGDEETFQAIIYDQAFYPASNGNNIIKFQYQVVNNVDQGSYGTPIVGHGQFATVGIEDHTGTTGLQYTYDNQYPSAAKTLENEMAICFNGPPIQHIDPFLILGDMIVQDENNNGILEYGEIANLQISLNNIGQNAAHNIQTVLSCSDPNATVTASISSYNDINGNSSGLNISDFVFEVAEDCPDGYLLPFQLDVTCSEDNWSLFFSLEVSSPNIVITNIVVEDGNNHIFNPGETADVVLTMENIGGAEALDLTCNFITSDPYTTINTASVSAGNIACGEIIEVVFEMMVDLNAPLQHEIELNAQLSTISNFTSTEDFSLYVTQVPLQLEEHFEIFPPTGWHINNTGGGTGWQYSASNVAGGLLPEIACICVPGIYYNERIESPELNTLGSVELELEFRQALFENLRNYTVRVETTDDGENWHTVWEHVGQNLQPHMNYVTINSPDVGSASFQIAFVFEGTAQSICAWVIDDILLEEVEVEPHGFIVGNVVLNGGVGNVEEVLVSVDEFAKNPDESGNYILPVAAGTYDVTASLPQYISSVLTDIEVTEWQVTEVNFSLEPVTINNTPQNLTAEVTFNDVHLEWEIPGSDNIPTRNEKEKRSPLSDNRSLLSYNVYRDNVIISSINDILITSYDDLELDGGDYLYYVTAVYNEGESTPSNIVNVSVELIPPQELVYQVTAPGMVLLQWDPPLPTASRDLGEYRVYRNNEMIAWDIASTFFFDTGVPAGSYTYYITVMYGQYESEPSNEVQVEMTNADNNLIPLITELGTNHPNPFNPTTTISFSLHEEQEVSLEIYNMKGQKVKRLVSSQLSAGKHSILWNGKDEEGKQISSGIYFYRMITDDYSASKKMIMLK